MNRELSYNEWQAYLHDQLGYSLNTISDYCQNADVDIVKIIHISRQAEFAAAKVSKTNKENKNA